MWLAMYHYCLKIHIYGGDAALESELQAVAPLERFEHEIRIFDHITVESLAECDVAVFDLPVERPCRELRGICKKGAELVFCADLREGLPEWAADFDDIWQRPFTPGLTGFHFRRLLERIKLKKDKWFVSNCLDVAMDSVPDLIWFKDVRGAHLKVNNAFCSAVGKTKNDVQGRGHYYIWDLKQEEYEQGEYVCLETEEIVLREKKTRAFDEKVKSKHGLRQFKTYKSPIFDEDHQVVGTVGIAHDVTDLKNMLTELEIVLGSMPFGILIKDSDGTIASANERFLRYFGLEEGQILGRNYAVWKHDTLGGNMRITDDGVAEAAIDINGDKMILEILREEIRDIFENQVGELYIYRDVTTERMLEAQVLHDSNTDFLTGLYNRRYFYEYVNKNRGRRPICFIYIDLDNFKKVNDTHGHQAGDEALVATADILRSCFPDAFIARLGGDEFIISLIGDCEIAAVEKRAGSLLRNMNEAFSHHPLFNILSGSIGIARTEDPSVDIDTLLRQSDIALYEVKRGGRAGYCVFPLKCSSMPG
ncbi:diguanylate cyclase [Cloacibacillus sp.]|uniref:sensor domain-containing diguanylate cyclase n=1 Tax=Cloacibacillus sp. TaxID=2049023 RepID=UPI0025C00810|nr:diguanylate cyclase [Cloacibacillus sp.]MCC8058079.1 diguanylate cyclase [Cloacibacillus sp.]